MDTKICSECGGKYYAKGLCCKCYNKQPEVKERKKKFMKKYYQFTKNKEKRKEYMKEYRKNYYQQSEVIKRTKEYNKEYVQRFEVKERMKEYRQRPEVKEKYKEYMKEYGQRPEVKEKYKEYMKEYMKEYGQRPEVKERVKEYYNNNIEKIRLQKLKYNRERWKNNIEHKILSNLRSRLKMAIKNSNSVKSSTTMKLIGCTIDELLIHLENQFDNRMNWKNMGNKGWHIHHMDECQDFDLTKEEDQKKCFHYKNLKPIWWTDHPTVTMENRKKRIKNMNHKV